MFRRTFFKSLGAAILGTAIALKIPDSLIPISIVPELSKIPIPTFAQLNELYNETKTFVHDPEYMIVSVDMLNALAKDNLGLDWFPTNDPFSNGLHFKHAIMLGSPFYTDENITCGFNRRNESKHLNLLTGIIK